MELKKERNDLTFLPFHFMKLRYHVKSGGRFNFFFSFSFLMSILELVRIFVPHCLLRECYLRYIARYLKLMRLIWIIKNVPKMKAKKPLICNDRVYLRYVVPRICLGTLCSIFQMNTKKCRLH